MTAIGVTPLQSASDAAELLVEGGVGERPRDALAEVRFVGDPPLRTASRFKLSA